MGTPNKSVAQVEAETQNEIEEIMSEIQNLQQGLVDAPKAKPPGAAKLKAVENPPESPVVVNDELPEADISMEDFRGNGGDASMEETLAGLEEEPVQATGRSLLDDATPDTDHDAHHETPHEEDSHPTPHSGEETMSSRARDDHQAPQEGSLTMTLSGSMTLKLRYEFEGQEVTVGFSENFLKVELSDGTEFKIPVGRSGLKAA